MKKIDTVHPDRFEFGMTLSDPPYVAMKILGVKGEELTIPLDIDEAYRVGVFLAGHAFAVKKAQRRGQSIESMDDDYAQLHDVINKGWPA